MVSLSQRTESSTFVMNKFDVLVAHQSAMSICGPNATSILFDLFYKGAWNKESDTWLMKWKKALCKKYLFLEVA